MSKKTKKNRKKQETPSLEQAISGLAEDELYTVIMEGMDRFTQKLEEQGVDPHLINAVLFEHFTDRMQTYTDQEQYLELLDAARELDWPLRCLH